MNYLSVMSLFFYYGFFIAISAGLLLGSTSYFYRNKILIGLSHFSWTMTLIFSMLAGVACVIVPITIGVFSTHC